MAASMVVDSSSEASGLHLLDKPCSGLCSNLERLCLASMMLAKTELQLSRRLRVLGR